LNLIIPSRSLPEQILKLEGKGFQYLDAKGDLFFTLKLNLPEKWSDDEIELLEKLRGVRLYNPRSSWFEQACTERK
tara:strand:+ start:713 stop:940 length:228 start_codon:yes stop_codon:yes gene_type:complete